MIKAILGRSLSAGTGRKGSLTDVVRGETLITKPMIGKCCFEERVHKGRTDVERVGPVSVFDYD